MKEKLSDDFKYKLAEGNSKEELFREIYELREQGFKPFGGIAFAIEHQIDAGEGRDGFSVYNSYTYKYCQAMIKE